MKTLNYTVTINENPERVFHVLLDKSVYADWAKAWGEGMTYQGEWKKGGHVSFFDNKQGGTKVIIEEFIPPLNIKAKHIAMVDTNGNELEPSDEMMRKWIGSQENYQLSKLDEDSTRLDITVVTDPIFEEMMKPWNEALLLLKGLCETRE